METQSANRLIKESSPYLKQHAYNPVDWYPWCDEAFEKARREDKPLLISIGYSACHWCHVMEKECFEDGEVAALMNEHFVCVKVDREERPDIDAIYMLAVQLMTQRGGWPLNCFTLPDGRPVYGGTYFPKRNWMGVLEKINEMYRHEPVEMMDYAKRLSEGMRQTELFKMEAGDKDFTLEELHQAVDRWKSGFDNEDGGPRKAPKFPMPVNYSFLMDYALLHHQDDVLKHVEITLDAMAKGGIYDQIGGGFARYSVDAYWKVPHFEKMLYDNAQLISLYAKAYGIFNKERYKEIVLETINFLDRDMKGEAPCYYAALDADSEGEEGRFYVWTIDELKSLLGNQFALLEKYFHIDEFGHWEHGNYILMRKAGANVDEQDSEAFAALKNQLLNERAKRVHPGLDDKYLLSWNALSITALCDAYKYLNEQAFLDKALQHFAFLMSAFRNTDGSFCHTRKNEHNNIPAFLDDYATLAQAALDLFACTGDEDFFHQVQSIIAYLNVNFSVDNSSFYYFAEEKHKNPVTRQIDVDDNVIPSSNAILAHVFYIFGSFKGDQQLKNQALKMLAKLKDEITQYPSVYAHWAHLKLYHDAQINELVITGAEANKLFLEFHQHYIPATFAVICKHSSDVPLLKGKFSADKTQLFICEGERCYAPLSTIKDTLEMLSMAKK